jgi:signal transduction histidine kinase
LHQSGYWLGSKIYGQGTEYFCTMKKLIRRLVIGDKKYFESWTEYRQVLLSGQFGLMALLSLIIFQMIEIASGYYQDIPVYAGSALVVLLTMRLHRLGYHCLANAILYPALITIVYLFTSSEAVGNGGVLFYIPIAIGAFATFEYKHRQLAFMVVSFSFFMFMMTFFVDVQLLAWREYSENEMKLNLLINFLIAFPASLSSLYTLVKLNHRNATQLRESNSLLKKSNTELDRFIYSTSHDLRAPLASVLGLINLSARSTNPEEVKQFLNMMEGRVHALEKFIKDITDYSRNSRLEVVKSTFNLYDLATEIWETLRYQPKAQPIQFEICFEPDFVIVSDPQRIRIILSNLISNAIRYHDCSKADKFIRLHCRRTEKSFVLSVEDNGQGIAPEYHAKIFQMFFRANETSNGSGLGLYIVHETIAKLSGHMQLQSVLKQGSTFTVQIPAR